MEPQRIEQSQQLFGILSMSPLAGATEQQGEWMVGFCGDGDERHGHQVSTIRQIYSWKSINPPSQIKSNPELKLVPDSMHFRSLARQWEAECGVMSSSTEMVMCPSYQRIIGMGPSAVPLILRQLEEEGEQPSNWFWALRAITGHDPVPANIRGNRRAMARAWLEWARGRYAW